MNGSSAIGVGGLIISTGMPDEQPMSPQGLQHFDLRKAKKWARDLVQHEVHDEAAPQPTLQLSQGDEQLGPQLLLQRRPQGMRQSSERSPRLKASSKQGRGQQLAGPHVGAGTTVLQPGPPVPQVVQLPETRWPNPTCLMTEWPAVGD
jgi:hypothetical protein